MDIKLKHFIPTQRMTPEIAECLTNQYITVNLPTEVVVTEPGFVVPRQARAYRTGLYIVDDNVMSYQQVRKFRGHKFRGTAYERGVYLVEVWEDTGDDGHVSWTHFGWRFIENNGTESEIRSTVLDEQAAPKERMNAIKATCEDHDAYHDARRKALDNS